MMADASGHDADFYLWTREQAAAIRDAAAARTNLPIDWENVAEEIADLGIGERRELASRIATIVEHLLKFQFSPADPPRPGWADTVTRSRIEIRRLFRNSPSLRRLVSDLLADEHADAARLAADALRHHSKASPEVLARLAAARFMVEQVLGDWFPDIAPPSR